MRFSYLLWVVIFLVLPLSIMWLMNVSYLKKYLKTYAVCLLFVVLFSVPWDYMAWKLQIWTFPPDRVLGVWIMHVPIEEDLFYIFAAMNYVTVTLLLRRRIKTYEEVTDDAA